MKLFNRSCLMSLSLSLTMCLTSARASEAASVATTGHMPVIVTESLAEAPKTLPRDLPAERSLVFMGFEFDHQKLTDNWVAQMKLRERNLPWVHVHVISRWYGVIGGFINSRKRPYYPDAYVRERVMPIYTDISSFMTSMGYPDVRSEQIVAVVDRSGAVLATARGDYDLASAQRLLEALNIEAPK